MNTRNKQLILIALLFSLAATLAYWQFYGAPATGNVGPVPGPESVVDPNNEDLYIRKAGHMDSSGGVRNIFDFGRLIVAVPEAPKVEFTPPPVPPPGPVGDGPKGPVTPPGPVNTPPIPLAYTGYARDDSNRMTAFLETSGASAAGHYNLRERDFLLGRYRINKISADAIEVEDIDRAETAADRRRTIAISPSIAVRR